MKKILLAAMICLTAGISFAQTINISTGVGNTANGQNEANGWKVNNNTPITVASYGSYWQPTPAQGCNARWINPTATVGSQAPGFYTYEKVINVPAGTKTLSLNLQLAYDDALTSLELVPPTGPSITLTAVTPKAYFLSKAITDSQSVCDKSGNWKIRAKVQYIDALGGFILCGSATLTKGCTIVCNCPKGWISNTSGTDGGITTDGRCKKLVCSPIGVVPPPDGTQLGNWGFTWGYELWAYGSKENGGAAICK